MTRAPADPSTFHRALAAIRAESPLIHCLTNSVTINHVANTLLALGATPAMVDIRQEAGAFAPVASAVLINIGTPHEEQRDAMREAAAAAHRSGTPWVLDPVAVGALEVRTALAIDLLEFKPAVIRGNASEIVALAGLGDGGRGVDATHAVSDARAAACALALATGAVVAVSGPTDLIVSGDAEYSVTGGDALLTRITGGGCALGAVVAAFCAVEADAVAATVAACSAYAVAAERAGAVALGPGSFVPVMLDELARLEPEDVRGPDLAEHAAADGVRA